MGSYCPSLPRWHCHLLGLQNEGTGAHVCAHRDLVGLDACTHQGRTCGGRYCLHVTPTSNVTDMMPQWRGDIWRKHLLG